MRPKYLLSAIWVSTRALSCIKYQSIEFNHTFALTDWTLLASSSTQYHYVSTVIFTFSVLDKKRDVL